MGLFEEPRFQELRFRQKVAVVTGGASGIGAAVVRRLHREGASVVVVDLDAAHGEPLAAEVGGRFVKADVGDPAAWDEIVAAAVDGFGGLDLAHLNAGIAMGAYPLVVEDLTDAEYRTVMRVNVDGVFFGIRACLRPMAARGGGAIVATSSLAGIGPHADDPVYAATKHAVIGLVRSLATPLAAHHVTINAICPGAVDTPLLDTTRRRDAIVAAGRVLMDPDEVARVVTDLLAGDETGEAYAVLAGRGGVRYEFRGVPGARPA
jgi:NAD(P)-dependent dehydrogenase (short-subunit alcohol dehydrogenase family)